MEQRSPDNLLRVGVCPMLEQLGDTGGAPKCHSFVGVWFVSLNKRGEVAVGFLSAVVTLIHHEEVVGEANFKDLTNNFFKEGMAGGPVVYVRGGIIT